MRELPAGNVTMLFSDIEGSTQLLHELGDRYAAVLVDHRRVLRDAFVAHGGVEVDTQGDAFFVVFPDAEEAVAAAADAQAALAGGPIRVRIGLHTGWPDRIDEGYVGEDVHLGARVAAAGHGGQVLLSKPTADSVDRPLTDLGEHRVKDFVEPVPLFQLGDAVFPPLKTISNTNLPRPASSFVGREREVSEVVSLLREGCPPGEPDGAGRLREDQAGDRGRGGTRRRVQGGRLLGRAGNASRSGSGAGDGGTDTGGERRARRAHRRARAAPPA